MLGCGRRERFCGAAGTPFLKFDECPPTKGHIERVSAMHATCLRRVACRDDTAFNFKTALETGRAGFGGSEEPVLPDGLFGARGGQPYFRIGIRL
jgi:hypothetical protein